MSDDISNILNNWEYDPANSIRIIKADNGRDVLQVRQPLGIEQYELEARPDGMKPFGKDTFLQIIEERLSRHILDGSQTSNFRISHDDFTILQNEGVLYYYRYLQLFQIGDFVRTIKDTEHNLQICNLAEKYCEDPDDKDSLLQYRPYILRINAISKAMINVRNKLKIEAKHILENAINTINEMKEIDTPAFKFEKIRSINYLKTALKQIDENPASPAEELKLQLDEAVAEEDYERAAWLRDQIKQFGDLE